MPGEPTCRQAWDDLPGLVREVRFGRSVIEKKVSDRFSVWLVISNEIFQLLQFDIFELLAIIVTLELELQMLQEEGERVGLGGGYQPQPGGGQVGQELVC